MTNFYNAALAETGDESATTCIESGASTEGKGKHLPICSLESENGASASIVLGRPASVQAAPIDAGNKMVLKRREPKAMASERGCRQETPHPV